MRIPPALRAVSGGLCGLLLLATGCTNPASQTLASLSVSASPSTVAVGGAVVLKATAHLSDGTTQDVTSSTLWTLSNSLLGTVTNGAITAKAPGALTVQAAYLETTPAGTSPSSATVSPQSLSASTQVTITQAIGVPTPDVPAVSWTAPAAITYGTALSSTQLNATANVPGNFVYTPALSAVPQAGTQTLSVLFTPTDTKTYSSATATVPLTVNQANPAITWAPLAGVASGTALSAAQLDATANVPGTFTYNPGAGVVPAAGTLQMAAQFTPTDTVNYTSASATNTLVVGGAPAPGPPGPGPTLPPLTSCGGPTVNVNSSMSQKTLQSTISSAPGCALIVFAAGTYNISAPVDIPCNVTVTGPTANPATAILAASYTGDKIFSVGNCSQPVIIGYLHFENTGGIYVTAPMSGITVTQSQFTHLPGNFQQTADMGIYFYGEKGGTISNATITNNTFGDPSSCSGVISDNKDDGGLCIGVFFQGDLDGVLMENNVFTHLEEGYHVLCYGNLCTGSGAPTWNNFVVQWNDFNNIHRIAMEMQPENANNVTIQYNTYENAFLPSTFSMGISAACCAGISGATVPFINNNVILANTKPAGDYIAYGIEWWGNGAQANHDVIQGYWANGIVWGKGGGPWQIENSIVEGPYMGGNYGCYMCNEHEGATTTPTESGNTTSLTVTPINSTAPTLSPAGGAISAATTVTLSDSGTNHSIYYTTDGSTPTTTSTLYTGPFSVTPGTTVNAIGMWGQGANPKSFPSGYGYLPSAMATANYAASSVVKQPGTHVSSAASPQPTVTVTEPAAAGLASIAILPSNAEVAVGGTTQLKALALFTDGSSKDISSEFSWASSDQRTIRATASGLLSGVATGKAIVSGSYRGLQASTAASSSIGDIVWSGPIVITAGGAYTGNWQSTESATPAVTIATTAPVVIENARIRSVASLIKTTVAGADVTVRNSLGFAASPLMKGQPNGVFLEASSPARLDVEKNYIENAGGGVVVHGYSGARDGQTTVVIRANRVRNLIGPLSDFVELDDMQAVPGVEIGWNEVINYPGRSLVADNIAIRDSGGTANQPLEIHDTYIQGASLGGGIKTETGRGVGAEGGPAFNSIHDNQVVGTAGYGIAFAAGHDNIAVNNRVISSGMLADGSRIAAQQVGMVNVGSYNNTMRDNVIGWKCWNSSCTDEYFPASPGDYSSNSVLAQRPTLAAEEAEYQIWLNKMSSFGVSVGPEF